jgi:hypothetical protein
MREMEMPRFMLIAATLAAGVLSLGGAVAQQQDQQQVSGTVTEADEQTHTITVNDQTFVMPEQSGTALFPQVGDKITLFYEEQGEEKVITRIGQQQN